MLLLMSATEDVLSIAGYLCIMVMYSVMLHRPESISLPFLVACSACSIILCVHTAGIESAGPEMVRSHTMVLLVLSSCNDTHHST